jgi:lysophospholipase L1-like esterase
MSKILIAGDSWSCGEWMFNNTTQKLEIVHKGLEHYIKNDGGNVTNIGVGGSSNLDSINRIKLWLKRFPNSAEKIFVFQTEYTRDFKFSKLLPEELSSITKFSDVANRWISRFYMRLSEIAFDHNCKIYIIGGTSDAEWFDDMNADHPGCHIACQSLTNLICNNNHKILDPVYSWYSNDSSELISILKKQGCNTEELLNEITKGFEREYEIQRNPKYFYPDGVHPNRDGHKILYDFLKQQNIL